MFGFKVGNVLDNMLKFGVIVFVLDELVVIFVVIYGGVFGIWEIVFLELE